MVGKYLRRPSPAMVVACLALGIALAGTSVAAVKLVIPRNSVGTLQLKANAVNSAKVRNHSLLRADFKAGQIPAGPRGFQGPAGPAGPQGPAGPPGATGAAGSAASLPDGSSVAFKTTTGDTAVSTNSTSFTDLTSTSITIPAGTTATVVATFSAESVCYGSTSYCVARITIDGNEMSPNVGTDFAWDSTDNNTEGSSSWESKAMVRSQSGIGAGSHTVTVQYSVTGAGTTLRLDDWGLSVVAYKTS